MLPGETKKRVLIAIVIVLTALIVAVAAKYIKNTHKKRQKRARFEIGNPAAPRQKTATKDLGIHLESLIKLGSAFQQSVAGMNPEEKTIAGVSEPMIGVVKSVNASFVTVNNMLAKSPRTYANLLGFYRGISGSDQNYLKTATAIENAGHSIHQNLDVARENGTIANLSPGYEAVGDAGEILIEFAREIRGLLISVHRLGAALDVE